MTDINKVVLIGRLTRDGELTYTKSGYPILKMALAVNLARKQNEQWVDEASFFEAVLWGRRGETLASYTTKGKQVSIDGHLRQERWENAQGERRSRVVIDVDNLQLLGGGERKKQESGVNQFVSEVHKSAEPAGNFKDDVPF